MTRRGGRAPVVTYNPEGWPDPHNRRLKLCNVQNIRACAGLPVWQVERWDRGYVAPGYYCDDDLPGEYRVAAVPPAVTRSSCDPPDHTDQPARRPQHRGAPGTPRSRR